MEEINFWRKYVFFPERELSVWPEDYGLKYEEAWFQVSDGILLYGWWIRGGYTLLLAHENGGNISDRVDIAVKLHDEGFSIFLFDYRGYGKSDGEPTEKGTYKDVDGAFQYLQKKLGIRTSRIVPIGESMGGAIVVELCNHYDFRAIVLISPAMSFSQVMPYVFLIIPHTKNFWAFMILQKR